MPFAWLHRTPPRPDGVARRVSAARDELAQRAAVLYRLGLTQAAATRRLAAAVAWEYDLASPRAFHRPAALSDELIAKVVADTFVRRPG